MRWLFALLLLVNFGLAYQIYQEPATPPKVTYLEDIGDIRLVGEIAATESEVAAAPVMQDGTSNGIPESQAPTWVTADALKPAPDAPAELVPGAVESQLDVTAGDAPDKEAEPTPDAEPAPDAETDKGLLQPADTAGLDNSSEEIVTGDALAESEPAVPSSNPDTGLPVPESASPTPENEEPATSEEVHAAADDSDSKPLAQPAPLEREMAAATVREVEIQKPQVYCAALGPSKQIGDARKLAQKLEARGIDSTLRRELEQRPLGFWVVLPPYKNQKAAIDAVLELRKKGIKDIRRFIEGEQRNGISLGVFSRRENAERRRREIAGKGFQARVEPRFVETAVYWVDYRSEGITPEELIGELRLDSPELEQKIQTCPRIVRP